MKEWLKSVLNCRSYPKNKIGYPFFWNTLYVGNLLCLSKNAISALPTLFTDAAAASRQFVGGREEQGRQSVTSGAWLVSKESGVRRDSEPAREGSVQGRARLEANRRILSTTE